MLASLERSGTTREIVSGAFDENDLIFIDELKAAVPVLSHEDVHWRFHFLVGAMIYTMSDSGQLSGLSGGACSPSDTNFALASMIQTFSALFRSPPMRGSRATKEHSNAKCLEISNNTRITA